MSSSGLVCDAAEVNAFGRLKETCKGAVRVLKRTLEAYCCHTHTQQKSGQLATIVLMAALKFVLYCLCTFCSFLYFTAGYYLFFRDAAESGHRWPWARTWSKQPCGASGSTGFYSSCLWICGCCIPKCACTHIAQIVGRSGRMV